MGQTVSEVSYIPSVSKNIYNYLSGGSKKDIEIPSEYCVQKLYQVGDNYFHAGKMNIVGTFPEKLFDYTEYIEVIRLYKNKIRGIIPYEIFHFDNLTVLDLSSNQIEGIIPESIGNLEKLTHLNLSYNRFIGEIPKMITKLVNVQVIDLQCNNLTGKVPKKMSNLTKLKIINLTQNKFIDVDQIFYILSLEELYLSHNDHLENFTLELLPLLTNLRVAHLYNCNIIGEIPEDIGVLRNLRDLKLGYNRRLSGCIPKSFQNLKLLKYFDFENTSIVITKEDYRFIDGSFEEYIIVRADAPILKLFSDISTKHKLNK